MKADILQKSGEHTLLIPGPAGQLEVCVTVPEAPNTRLVAFLGHPHSLQGGTMSNKVVTTIARALSALAIPSVRFNFRGVGKSEGVYDAGLGESEDMLFLLSLWQDMLPSATPLFAGFSFGSYVAYRAAAQSEQTLLVTIAPPVHHYDYTEFHAPNPWTIIQGDADDVTPYALVDEFARTQSPRLEVVRFADTGHFFHGKLIELRSVLSEVISSQVLSR